MSLSSLRANIIKSGTQSVTYKGFNVSVEYTTNGLYEALINVVIDDNKVISVITVGAESLSSLKELVIKSIPEQSAEEIKELSIKCNAYNISINDLFEHANDEHNCEYYINTLESLGPTNALQSAYYQGFDVSVDKYKGKYCCSIMAMTDPEGSDQHVYIPSMEFVDIKKLVTWVKTTIDSLPSFKLLKRLATKHDISSITVDDLLKLEGNVNDLYQSQTCLTNEANQSQTCLTKEAKYKIGKSVRAAIAGGL